MSEKTIGKKMLEELSYSKKNVFEVASSDKIKAIYDYADGYMEYLDNSKTEREATDASIAKVPEPVRNTARASWGAWARERSIDSFSFISAENSAVRK